MKFYLRYTNEIPCPRCQRKGTLVRLRSKNMMDRIRKMFFIRMYKCEYCSEVLRILIIKK